MPPDLDIDFGSGHMAPLCITHRPLPTYQISRKLEKRSVDGRTDERTYERTYVRRDRQTSMPALLGPSRTNYSESFHPSTLCHTDL